jgi:hypothetical protein
VPRLLLASTLPTVALCLVDELDDEVARMVAVVMQALHAEDGEESVE